MNPPATKMKIFIRLNFLSSLINPHSKHLFACKILLTTPPHTSSHDANVKTSTGYFPTCCAEPGQYTAPHYTTGATSQPRARPCYAWKQYHLLQEQPPTPTLD